MDVLTPEKINQMIEGNDGGEPLWLSLEGFTAAGERTLWKIDTPDTLAFNIIALIKGPNNTEEVSVRLATDEEVSRFNQTD